MKALKNIGIAVAALGLICTLAIMVYTTSWEEGVDFTLPFLYLWVLLPYIVLLVTTVKIHRRGATDASRIAIFIASLVVAILSVLIYYDSMFVSVTSTSALIFLALPLCALAAIAIVYLVSWLLIRFIVRRRESS
jgi:hypothetical protein